MKKLMFAFATLALLASSSTFTSCKKGENDPFLSLRSRKARLAGEWTLKEGVITATNTQSDGTVTVLERTYTETEEVVTLDGVQEYVTTLDVYTLKFDKDGNFEYVIGLTPKSNSSGPISDPVSSTQTMKGIWSFLGKDQEREIKNKEAIILAMTENDFAYEDGSFTTSVNRTGFADGDIQLIDMLKNKEITLVVENTLTHESGSIEAWSSSMTYTKD